MRWSTACEPGPDARVVARQLGRGELRAQRVEECLVRIAQAHRGDAPLGGRDQQPAQRGGRDRVAQAHAAAAAAVGGGSHAQAVRRALVHAAARAVPGVVDGGGHGISFAQALPQGAQPKGVGVLARADADDPLERPLEVVGPPADLRAQGGEAQRRVRGRLDAPAHRPHPRRLAVARRGLAGTAAAAGAEPRALGGLGHREEDDVPPARPAGGARGPAVDPRGPHAEHEGPVEAAVPGAHRPPPPLVLTPLPDALGHHIGEYRRNAGRDPSGSCFETQK